MPIRISMHILSLIVFGISSISVAAESEVKSMEQKFSYTLGYTFGKQMQSQVIAVDKAALIVAIDDVFAGKEPRISKEEMAEALGTVKEKIKQMGREKAQRTHVAGKKFMDENKKMEGVVVLPNGISIWR